VAGPLRCVECDRVIRSPKTEGATLVRLLIYTPGGLAKWIVSFHRRCATGVAITKAIKTAR
jgi:hypothetical protein